MGFPISVKDGKIRGEVGIGSGASITGEIDPNNVDNSRAGIGFGGVIPGGGIINPGGTQVSGDVSIGKEGAKIETKAEAPGGVQGGASINASPGGDVSGKADIGIPTPLGDFGASVEVSKIGCTITVAKTFTSPLKTFSTTEVYTDPKCNQPSPSPSPSPTPQGIGYPSDKLPVLDSRCTYVFHVLVQLGQVEYFNFIRIGGFPAYEEIWENVVNKSGANSTYIESVYIDSSGNYRATVGGTEPIDRAPAYKRITRWQLGGNICTPAVFNNTYMPQYQRNYPDAAFNIYPRLISCSYPKPWPDVPPGQLIEIPKWNPPPMAQDKCCDASTSILRKLMLSLQDQNAKLDAIINLENDERNQIAELLNQFAINVGQQLSDLITKLLGDGNFNSILAAIAALGTLLTPLITGILEILTAMALDSSTSAMLNELLLELQTSLNQTENDIIEKISKMLASLQFDVDLTDYNSQIKQEINNDFNRLQFDVDISSYVDDIRNLLTQLEFDVDLTDYNSEIVNDTSTLLNKLELDVDLTDYNSRLLNQIELALNNLQFNFEADVDISDSVTQLTANFRNLLQSMVWDVELTGLPDYGSQFDDLADSVNNIYSLLSQEGFENTDLILQTITNLISPAEECTSALELVANLIRNFQDGLYQKLADLESEIENTYNNSESSLTIVNNIANKVDNIFSPSDIIDGILTGIPGCIPVDLFPIEDLIQRTSQLTITEIENYLSQLDLKTDLQPIIDIVGNLTGKIEQTFAPNIVIAGILVGLQEMLPSLQSGGIVDIAPIITAIQQSQQTIVYEIKSDINTLEQINTNEIKSYIDAAFNVNAIVSGVLVGVAGMLANLQLHQTTQNVDINAIKELLQDVCNCIIAELRSGDIKVDFSPVVIAIDNSNTFVQTEIASIVNKALSEEISAINKVLLAIGFLKDFNYTVDNRFGALEVVLSNLRDILIQFSQSTELELSQIKGSLTNISTDLKAEYQNLLVQLDNQLIILNALQQQLKPTSIDGSSGISCGNLNIQTSYNGNNFVGLSSQITSLMPILQAIANKVCQQLPALPPGNPGTDAPLISGAIAFSDCQSSPHSIPYSGVGVLGLSSQLSAVVEMNQILFSSMCGSDVEISGNFTASCGTDTLIYEYSGAGVLGLSDQIQALGQLAGAALQKSCEVNSCVPLLPDERFAEFIVTRQLVITLGTQYPTQKGSLWHIHIPMPRTNLNWCEHFENLEIKKGNIYGRQYWENSKIFTGTYFENEEEARKILAYLCTLSDAAPRQNNGSPAPRISSGGAVKRIPANRTVRAVKAVVSDVDPSTGEATALSCFTPPPGGC